METNLKLRGFSRVQIVNPDGSIAGDSGFTGPNQVTNLGVNNFLAQLLGGMAGSVVIQSVALGTGTEPGAAHTSLDQELGAGVRIGVTAATSSTSFKLRLTATFASTDSFVTNGPEDIANIGLFATTGAGTLFAGNTYASSSCASNQQVNVTYDIDFTTS